MSLSALFYFNGILEGTTAYACWNKPEIYTNGNKMDSDGRMYVYIYNIYIYIYILCGLIDL